MTQATQRDTMDAPADRLRELEREKVRLTIDGKEYVGHVGHVDYAPYIHHDQWPDEGEIDATVDLDGETVERHGLPTGQVGILGKETRPGEWEDLSASVWAPEVEDGTVVRDDYESLGTVEKVEKVADGGS